MALGSPFLLDILAHPDDTLRLVYADWLMEGCDPRGQFIRVQIERSRLERNEARWGPL